MHNSPKPQKNEEQQQTQLLVNLSSSVISTFVVTMVTHPLDRAFYLAVKEKRPFFIRANFGTPYHAFSQALMQRALFGSPGYLFLKDEMKKAIGPFLRNDVQLGVLAEKATIGCLTGGMHGFLSSAVLALKAYTWGDEKRTFSGSISTMYQKGGLAVFGRGAKITTIRDAVSAPVYESIRHILKNSEEFPIKSDFLCNSIASMTATLATALINYVRIVQVSTEPDCPTPKAKDIVTKLWSDSNVFEKDPLRRAAYIAQRMHVGVGLIRFALFMPAFQKVYDSSQKWLGEQFGPQNNGHPQLK